MSARRRKGKDIAHREGYGISSALKYEQYLAHFISSSTSEGRCRMRHPRVAMVMQMGPVRERTRLGSRAPGEAETLSRIQQELPHGALGRGAADDSW